MRLFSTLPGQATVVSATDGTYTDKVVVTWTNSTGATGYRVYEGTNVLATLGDVATYNDVTAPAPTITPGASAASDGTAAAYVALSLSGASANNGTPRTYKVVAFNTYGDGDDSSTDTGYRGVGSLTYQWQESAADTNVDYSNISGATNSTCNDTNAPIYTVNAPTSISVSASSTNVLSITFSGASVTAGAGRYYQCILDATGASEQTSTSNRGYRNDTITAPDCYEVFSDTSPGGAYSTSEGTTSASPFDDTDLSANTRKYYKIKAMSTASTPSSLPIVYDGKYTLAPTPTNLTATAISYNSITMTVDSFPNAASDSSGYYFSRSGGGNSGWIHTNTWQDTGLTCGASYTYSVQYRNGDSVPTGSISLNTTTADCILPSLGTYNGLVIQTNAPSHASSGSVKFTVSKTLSFTAQLTMGGVKATFKGQFDASGNATNTVTLKGLAPMQVILHSDSTDRITGTVSNDVFASELLADRVVYNRTNSCPSAGSYTVVLEPLEGSDPSMPQGCGYGTLTVTTIGGGKLSGVLGDGTKVKGNMPVSKYGTWPLYNVLYKKQGSCIGWVTFNTNSTLEATVNWFKPSILVSNCSLSLLGSTYVVPAKGEPMLALTNALVTLGYGDLTGVLSNLVTVASNNTVTVMSGDITNLTLKLTPKTGLFSGGFRHPATGKTTKFQGAVLQLQDFGAGYFLGTNESGYVIFEEPMP